MIWNLNRPPSEPPLIKEPFEPGGEFENVAFSDNSTLVAGSWRAFRRDELLNRFLHTHLIFIWNTDTGTPSQTIAILDPELVTYRPSGLSFDPDNRWLVAGFRCITIPNSEPNFPRDDGDTGSVISNAK